MQKKCGSSSCHSVVVSHSHHGPQLFVIVCSTFKCTFSMIVLSLRLRRHAHGPLAEHLMHIAHLTGNSSGFSKSSSDWLNSTGCVSRSLMAHLETNAVMPNPLMEKECRRVYNYDNERLPGSTKRWMFKSMWSSQLHCCSKLAQLSWMNH